MSPRDLSTQTITARLLVMRELLDDLDAVGDLTADDLARERLRRRAAERILTQLVDLACDINQHVASTMGGEIVGDYRQSFDAAARVGLLPAELAAGLKPSVGLRNVLTHEYVNIDLSLLAQSIPRARDSYAAYVRAAAGWLRGRPD